VQIIGFALWGASLAGLHAAEPRAGGVGVQRHALIMVTPARSRGAHQLERPRPAVRTFTVLRELIPGLRLFRRHNDRPHGKERDEFYALWRDGKKASALAVAEKSDFPASSRWST